MSNDEMPEEGNADSPIDLEEDTPADDKADNKDEKKEEEGDEKDEDKDGEKKSEDAEMKDSEEDEKKKEELKKKYANWPLRNIKDPHENDVMYGRGGGTNHHPGNKKYRKMVEDRKLEYVNSKRLDKPLVALEIIRTWRSQLPPGRFLKLDEKTGLWNDVGDKKAREKTSQALREKAPLIRKQQEDDDPENAEEDGAKAEKTTRFAEGTKEESNQVKKAVLARDHSLGREYIPAGEEVSLEGFSWQDPFKAKKQGSFSRPAGASHPAAPPPPPVPPAHVGTAYPPAGRNSSHGSLGMAPPHHTSVGGPPPPPDFYGRETSHDRQRQFSNGRFDSWGSPYPYPPPPPPGINGSMHQRSGSWQAGGAPPMPQPHAPSHQRSGSWGSGREHSLSFNPLGGTALNRPADRKAFDSRGSSGYWGEPMSSNGVPPPPAPPAGYLGRFPSGGSLGAYRQPVSPCGSLSPPNSNSPKPPYNIDMSIARSWSGGEVRKGWSGDEADMKRSPLDGFPQAVPGASTSPPRQPGLAPRPQMVKRDTSNQCETYETKPQVKRAALNRDNSLASNRLKQEYMPEYFNNKFSSDQEVKTLSVNLEQSSLGTPKPKSLGDDGRVSTVDAIAMALAKPEPLLEAGRISTIDALDLDLDADPVFNGTDVMQRERSRDSKVDLPKPVGLSQDNRLTTQDFMDLVNAPISDGRESPVIVSQDRDTSLSLNQERIADEWLTQV